MLSVADSAPADEYFGRLQYSVLVIRHKIFALKDELHHDRREQASILHDADGVTDAFNDWTDRFSKDPWIPRTGWELATLYEELPGEQAHEQAIRLLQFVRDRYRWSAYASDSEKDLARGIGVRPWPAKESVVAANSSPLPSPAVRIAASPAPSPSAPHDAASLIATLLDIESRARSQPSQVLLDAFAAESNLRRLSREGVDQHYVRAFWEMAVIYQLLPGPDAREHAVRLLSLVLDRYSATVYGRWSLRDLERGIGERTV